MGGANDTMGVGLSGMPHRRQIPLGPVVSEVLWHRPYRPHVPSTDGGPSLHHRTLGSVLVLSIHGPHSSLDPCYVDPYLCFLYCPDATLDRILWRGQGSNQSLGFEGAGKGVVHGAFGCTPLEDQRDLKGVGDVSTLGLQVPPQKVFGPSKPTPNTFLEGTYDWSPRDSHFTHQVRRSQWTLRIRINQPPLQGQQGQQGFSWA